MTERTVLANLLWHVMERKKHQVAVPNSNSTFRWEADLISLTAAGLYVEWEIKLSRADYRRDFRDKKWKHQILAGLFRYPRRPCRFWFVTHGFDPDPPVPEYAGWIRWEHLGTGHAVGQGFTVEKEALLLDGKRAALADYRQLARLLSFRVKGLYGQAQSR